MTAKTKALPIATQRKRREALDAKGVSTQATDIWAAGGDPVEYLRIRAEKRRAAIRRGNETRRQTFQAAQNRAIAARVGVSVEFVRDCRSAIDRYNAA
jgi:hypothetical protein